MTFAGHSHIYGLNICKLSFFLITTGFGNVLEHWILPGNPSYPHANSHSAYSMSNLKQEGIILAGILRGTVNLGREGIEAEVWGCLLSSQWIKKQREYWFSGSFLFSLFHPIWASSPLDNATHRQGVSLLLG